MPPRMLLASELFARAHSTNCEGDQECHYCSAPCKRIWIHNDPPPIPFVRSLTTAKRPGNGYICAGCWIYQRKRVTIPFLRPSKNLSAFQDGGRYQSYSWYFTEREYWALDDLSHPALWKRLLNPERRFVLSFKGDGVLENLLQLMVANDVRGEMRADCRFSFTVGGVPFTYTIYDLEDALTGGSLEGKDPGVRYLIEKLGPYEIDNPKEEEEKRKRGRPRLEDEKSIAEKGPNRKLVTSSGS